MCQPSTLTGKLITLRTLEEKDATKEYASWLNDPEVNKYLTTKSVTLSELRDYIREKNADENIVLFGIFWKDKHIGNVKLEDGLMGLLIGDKEYWGKGVGSEAVNLITNYAFSIGYKEVRLGVKKNHTKAISLYKKCGYKVDSEGDDIRMVIKLPVSKQSKAELEIV